MKDRSYWNGNGSEHSYGNEDGNRVIVFLRCMIDTHRLSNRLLHLLDDDY